MSTKRNIERLFNVIDKSLFMVTGNLDYDRITRAISLLADTVHGFEGDTENLWTIGEFGNCTLDDLIVGAYWHYTEYHKGQYSNEYAALCSLGNVFDPNMSSVEQDNPAYEALNSMHDCEE